MRLRPDVAPEGSLPRRRRVAAFRRQLSTMHRRIGTTQRPPTLASTECNPCQLHGERGIPANQRIQATSEKEDVAEAPGSRTRCGTDSKGLTASSDLPILRFLSFAVVNPKWPQRKHADSSSLRPHPLDDLPSISDSRQTPRLPRMTSLAGFNGMPIRRRPQPASFPRAQGFSNSASPGGRRPLFALVRSSRYFWLFRA